MLAPFGPSSPATFLHRPWDRGSESWCTQAESNRLSRFRSWINGYNFQSFICLKHQNYSGAYGKFSSWRSCKMLRISCSWSLVWGWTPSLSSHRSTANLGWVVSCNLSNFCLYTRQEDVRALFLLTPPLVPVTYVLRIMILKVKGQVCCYNNDPKQSFLSFTLSISKLLG